MASKFISNLTHESFLTKIKHCLSKCNSFTFSVSFIKKAGLVLLQSDIERALLRGAKGRIITSTYQNFTDIESLNTFLKFKEQYQNFDCHLEFESFKESGFHSKGYIFEYDDYKEIVIGSTNITRFALLRNIEWNLSYDTSNDDDSINEAYNEFELLWNKTLELDSHIIELYRLQLDYAIEKWDMDYFEPESFSVHPNMMQKKALKEIRRYRDLGSKKALVISATGSGKTFLAAFDARNFDAKRVLFIVHRESILNDALDTFHKVFGAKRSYGLYSGKHKNEDCDFLFATNSMMANHLDDFLDNEFDYIVIDEVHHASASTYQKIMKYFKPEFLLGLTATPERMDQEDIFGLFENNVPYELRLRDAIINDLVVPFHYYGIRDKLVDYSIEDRSKIAKQIASNLNCELIAREIENHRQPGKLKALAFCVSIAHAKLMAELMQLEGYTTTYLTGENDTGERIRAFKDLQDDNNSLEIIFAVDILNEGVDIPGVNMVLFLRPTESATIFIQQLGRGLRKYEGKKYVTVLDFIGNNYNRSVQMALALGTLGRTTYMEKSYLMDLIKNDFNDLNIPDVVIKIDALSKEEVLNYLSIENFNTKKYLEQDYRNFKNYLKLKTYPSHMDYLESDLSPDLIRFMKSPIKGKKNFSYYSFLEKIGEDTIPLFNDEEKILINNISDLLPLVRKEEYLIINELLNGRNNFDSLVDGKITNKSLEHSLKILNKLKIINNNHLNINNCSNSLYEYLTDLILYGLKRYEQEFGDFDGKFKLYGNYQKSQIMMVLKEKSLMYMKGTKFNPNNETIIFVGLKKDKQKEEKLNYKDKFLNPKIFQWESENNTTLTNGIGLKIINTKIVHLFVRKMDDEDGITLPFTYFGTGKFSNIRPSMNNDKPTLLCDIILDNEVDKEYHFDFEIKDEGN